jgi:nitrite reductase/ring-hydroxylating ferredoxin subunit
MWHRLLRGDELARGAIVAATIHTDNSIHSDARLSTVAAIRGGEIVVWRTADGVPCAVARICPHLDWDLLDASVQGSELVCAGHGWSILGDGRVFKRNELGREDAKGTTPCVTLREVDGFIEAATA